MMMRLLFAVAVTVTNAFVQSPLSSPLTAPCVTTRPVFGKAPEISWRYSRPIICADTFAFPELTPRTSPTSSSSALHSATISSDENNQNNNNNKLLQIIKSTDIPLLVYFALWYVGNYYYKISNKRVLVASGGASGFPLTIASLQLAIGSLYGIFLWLAPDARARPQLTRQELTSMLPLAFCYAATHCASCFSYSAGSVSFAEIIKAGEPVFAAILAQFVYNRKISRAKWACLPVIIGGVILAAVQELDFAMAALVSACLANLFAGKSSHCTHALLKFEKEAGATTWGCWFWIP